MRGLERNERTLKMPTSRERRTMTDNDFLTRTEFENLSGEEQDLYVRRFLEALDANIDEGVDGSVRSAWAVHFFELAKWLLPPEEHVELVGIPKYEAALGRADKVVSTLEDLLANEEWSNEEKAELRAALSRAYMYLEHKRTIDEL
jgi:hypothetical protein